MIFKIDKNKTDVNSFAVCLLDVPEFPEHKESISSVVRMPLMAVIGAVLDDYDGWSFASLSKEEKHIIGDLLLKKGAKVDEWWWCTQFAERFQGI